MYYYTCKGCAYPSKGRKTSTNWLDGRSEIVLGRFRSWSARVYPINQPSGLLAFLPPASNQLASLPPQHGNNTLTFVFHSTIPHSLLSFLPVSLFPRLSACADSRLPSALSIDPTPPPPTSQPRTPAPPGLRNLLRSNNNSLRGTGRSGFQTPTFWSCSSPLRPTHSQELSQNSPTMPTLLKRQTDNLGMDETYDYHDYNSQRCYEAGDCSWWWSNVSTSPSLPIQKPQTNTLPSTDRLRRPLHHSRHPLLPPLRLLPRRLLARAPPRAQKPPTPSLPPLDGKAPQRALPALLGRRRRADVRLTPSPPAQQPPQPLLHAPTAAPGLLRHAGEHARAPAPGLSCWRCAAARLSAAAAGGE